MFIRAALLGLLFVSSVYGQFPYSKKFPPPTKRRKLVLQVISTGKASGNVEWTEESLAEAMYWYDKGDHKVLGAILDAGDHCDGATAEELGSWLGDTFITHPREILKAVAMRPVPKRKKLGLYAVAADGGGQGPEKMLLIRKLLNRFSRSTETNIAMTARLWLEVLGQYEADPLNQQISP
ncbi:MAG: hypothetical protein HXX12_15030 [Geothrix sp.]|uniref:hypothetical protein n=1 Tax=Geothrix sp. TaxID=1962974 RepID=UPI0017C8E709|nr:hypothetical protein [Geothrix sp.]NWJ42274.1 hypothetical protein [Geothrix sp.]WIL19759.1 MAG: hypothetical protein QOZ81_002290 [Geothrix sp.]